ncbi:hypothetical protein XELAEV_18031441mg [Xenopus laevis]|uniref:Uncharacterized protein n=1 Tax=Xenopus laevis TaxID=8355 RepID=A0A974CMR1_XENLA|nr:hypothetical protein XELAEV_18031441mg [Xenopus laevis]
MDDKANMDRVDPSSPVPEEEVEVETQSCALKVDAEQSISPPLISMNKGDGNNFKVIDAFSLPLENIPLKILYKQIESYEDSTLANCVKLCLYPYLRLPNSQLTISSLKAATNCSVDSRIRIQAVKDTEHKGQRRRGAAKRPSIVPGSANTVSSPTAVIPVSRDSLLFC